MTQSGAVTVALVRRFRARTDSRAAIRGWPRTFTRAIRRHRAFSAVFAAGLVLRAVVAFAYPPALEFHGDSYTYLANVGHLVPRLDRPIGYPVLLKVLSVTGSLQVVTLFQHVLGLGIGLAIYLVLRRAGARSWLATLAAAPVLLDGYQLDIEQFVMSETLFEVCLLAAFTVLLFRRSPGWRACLAVGLLLAAASLTRTLGLVLVVPALAYLLLLRMGIRRVAALLVGFALPMLAYAGWFDAVHGRFDVSGYSGIFLYGELAPVADCAKLHLPAYDRVLCDPTPRSMRLGPNFYDWSSDSPRMLLVLPPGVSYEAALSQFNRQVLLHDTLGYAAEVSGEVIHYFAPGRFVGPRDWYLATWQFPTNTPLYAEVWHANPANLGFNGPIRATPRWYLTPFLRGYQDVVYTPGPLLALALLLALVGAARRRVGAGRARAGALALAIACLELLVVPSAAATFDYRYLLPVIVLLPIGGALGLQVLCPRLAGAPIAGPAHANSSPGKGGVG
ncbi:MAG: hypothetical protein ACYCO3_05745 [Mycobacteriales bacterium]